MCSFALEIQLIAQHAQHQARQHATCRCYRAPLLSGASALQLLAAALSEQIAECAEVVARAVCSQHLLAAAHELSLAAEADDGPSLLARTFVSEVLVPLKRPCKLCSKSSPHLCAVAKGTLAPAANAALHVIADEIITRELKVTVSARLQLEIDFDFYRSWIERELGALCGEPILFAQLPTFDRQAFILTALDPKMDAPALLPDATQWRALCA